jgi:hypothetical protein
VLDRAAGEALLAKLDEFAGELARFRAEVVAMMPPAEGNGLDADDHAALIDTTSAAARFGFMPDTVRKMCGEIDGIGVSAPRTCWPLCEIAARIYEI